MRRTRFPANEIFLGVSWITNNRGGGGPNMDLIDYEWRSSANQGHELTDQSCFLRREFYCWYSAAGILLLGLYLLRAHPHLPTPRPLLAHSQTASQPSRPGGSQPPGQSITCGCHA